MHEINVSACMKNLETCDFNQKEDLISYYVFSKTLET